MSDDEISEELCLKMILNFRTLLIVNTSKFCLFVKNSILVLH